jgi:hypothetical protein
LNQILRRQTSRSHYGSKVPAVTVTVFKYRNKIGKIVVQKRIGYTKSKKSLKIPKGQSESVYRRRTDNTMGGEYKRTNNDLQNMHIK